MRRLSTKTSGAGNNGKDKLIGVVNLDLQDTIA